MPDHPPVPPGDPRATTKPDPTGDPQATTKPDPTGDPRAARRPIRLLLADSSALHRAGLRTVLTGSDGEGGAELVVAGEAADGAEAVELARRLLPDVLVADVALPRMDGAAVARAIVAARLPVPVLALTAHDGDEELMELLGAGATGYLCKDAPPEELSTAIRAVAAGGAVITPQVLARALPRFVAAASTTGAGKVVDLRSLTGREREVLMHVARGHTNAEIAEVLRVSETTVKTHVGHMLAKLRLRDRTQAVVLAYETGLVKPGG
ncbi:DNA-binding response regulator [Actinoplanes regularis]|nr:DNA-binding response regulator [Actinoplanes regularis]